VQEKEFWTWYVRSKFFRSEPAKVDAENPLNQYYEEMMASQSVPKAEEAADDEASVVEVVGSNEEDSGSWNRDRPVSKLIEKLNKALMKTLATTNPPLVIEDMDTMPELMDRKAVPPQPLNENVSSVLSLRKTHPSETSNVNEFLSQLSSATVDGATNMIKPLPLVNYIEAAPMLNPSAASLNKFLKAETVANKEARDHQLKLIEVLGLFWAAFTSKPSEERIIRIARLSRILEQLLLFPRKKLI